MVSFSSDVQHIVLENSEHYVQNLTLVFSLLEPLKQVDVVVTSSNNVSSWILSVFNEGSDEKPTYHVGPLSMGKDVTFAEGMWEVSILNNDGRTLFHSFEVNLPSLRDEQAPAYDQESRVLSIPFETEVVLFNANEKMSRKLLDVQEVRPTASEAFALVRGRSKQVSYLITL